MNKNKLIALGILLLAIGFIKPTFINNFFNVKSEPVAVDTRNFPAPISESTRSKANDVIKALSVNEDRKIDGKKLANLYMDIALLISLDEKNEVIKNTEEIRQANKLAGSMLQLKLKDKYENLAEANQALIVDCIGDDNVPLTKDLREKAVEAFKALAWACNEGSK